MGSTKSPNQEIKWGQYVSVFVQGCYLSWVHSFLRERGGWWGAICTDLSVCFHIYSALASRKLPFSYKVLYTNDTNIKGYLPGALVVTVIERMKVLPSLSALTQCSCSLIRLLNWCWLWLEKKIRNSLKHRTCFWMHVTIWFHNYPDWDWGKISKIWSPSAEENQKFIMDQGQTYCLWMQWRIDVFLR